MRIAIYPAQSGKIWTGDTLERESLGGSETAVIEVARGLAKKGHEVLVFTLGEPSIYDDVVYLDFNRAKNILRTLPLDAIICSRDPYPLIWSHRAKVTALWHHDLPQGKMPDCSFDACVTQWQASIYVNNGLVPQQRVRVINNGIDANLFQWQQDAQQRGIPEVPKLVWTSNPERGLWLAGTVLQMVRQEFPTAELHVYGRNSVYGWGESYEGNFLPDSMDGVVMHESLPKAELAHALSEADIWLYPTWWPETYCIAAVEAQAAGLPVVCSQFGALEETVKGGVQIPGRPHEEGHLNVMAQAVVTLLRNPEKRAELAATGRAYAMTQTWAEASNAWEFVLQSQMSA